MAKRRLKPKKYAKQTASRLAQEYTIKYSPDGSTFQIYRKDVVGAPVSREELLRENQSRLFHRKKKLVNKYFEQMAGTADAKESNNDTNSTNVITDDDLDKVKKEIEESLKNTLIKKYEDILKDKDEQINKLSYIINNKKEDKEEKDKDDENYADESIMDNLFGYGNDVVYYKPYEAPFNRDISEFEQVGLPTSNEILDVTEKDKLLVTSEIPESLFDFSDKPTLDYFELAKKLGKKYIVFYNDVYNVDDNLELLKSNKAADPVVDQTYVLINPSYPESPRTGDPELRPRKSDATFWDRTEFVRNEDAPLGFSIVIHGKGNVAKGRPKTTFETLGRYILPTKWLNTIWSGLKLWNFANTRGLPAPKEKLALPQGLGRPYVPIKRYGGKLLKKNK